jgi:hypothetical protein
MPGAKASCEVSIIASPAAEYDVTGRLEGNCQGEDCDDENRYE